MPHMQINSTEGTQYVDSFALQPQAAGRSRTRTLRGLHSVAVPHRSEGEAKENGSQSQGEEYDHEFDHLVGSSWREEGLVLNQREEALRSAGADSDANALGPYMCFAQALSAP